MMSTNSAWRLKAIGACLLMVCFALPMKSCTEYRHANGERVSVEPGESLPPDARQVTTRYYLVEEFRADQPITWVQIAAFVLPLAAVAYARWGRPGRFKKVLWF